jgi:uncharacterized protein
LPKPEPPRWQDSDVSTEFDLLNPFVIIAVFMIGAMFRNILGRLIGSLAAGGAAGLVAGLMVGSIATTLVAGGIVFAVPLISHGIFAGGGPPVGRGRYGRGWAGGSWSGGGGGFGGGGFRGGGGGFGGGGASGSW